MKSGNLNFLEPSGSVQACNVTALPLSLPLLLMNILLQCVHEFVLEEFDDEPTSLSFSLFLQDQPAEFTAETFPIIFVIDSLKSLLNI